MVGIVTLLSLLIGLYLARYPYRFIRNVIVVVRAEIPYFTVPIDHNNLVWVAASVALRSWFENHLPSWLWGRLQYAIYGWEFHGKLQPFHRATDSKTSTATGYEKTFALIGCSRFELWTADPAVAQQILSRPLDFLQLDLAEPFVALFGPNVLSSNGHVWSRQRRIVATAVTERISPVVWTESIKQAKGMIQEISSNSKNHHAESNRFFDMVKTLTINVLSRAGLGVEKPWTPESLDPEKGAVRSSNPNDVSYMDAVKILNDNMTGPIILPIRALIRWPSFMPGYKDLRRLGWAKTLFPLRTQQLVSEEKDHFASNDKNGKAVKNNLLSMLVSASDNNEEEKDIVSSVKKKPGMTDEELVSNLYIFTAAGYDTTANTIAYSITLLMRYPKWQTWLFEEIDAILEESSPTSDENGDPDYQSVFPKCVRVMSFMFETLRLFPVVIHAAKMTKHPQKLVIQNNKEIVVPAYSLVYVDTVALHLDAATWRDLNPSSTVAAEWESDMPGRSRAIAADVESGGGKLGEEWRFRPTRWINAKASSALQSREETIFKPPPGTFLPWSMGPRVCPGQRMAYVEYTAIMFMILSKYRLEAVRHDGESVNALNGRLEALMQNSTAKLALEMEIFNLSGEATQSKSAEQNGVSRGLKVRIIPRR